MYHVNLQISSVSPLKTDQPWWKKTMFISAILFLGNLISWPWLWQPTTTSHTPTPGQRKEHIKSYFFFDCSDGKVLVDLVKIHSDACHGCPADKEKVTVRLRGERTSEYEDGIPCLTNFLDRKHENDYVNGSVEFDGRWKGQEDEQEIELLGECFQVMS